MAFCSLAIPVLPRSEFLSPACTISTPPSCRKVFAATHRQAIHAELQAEPPTALTAAVRSEQLIRRYWNLAANGKYSTTISCFADDAVYHDGLYPQPFVGREAILAHFTSLEASLPPNLMFVLDDVTASEERAGARWHVETEGGRQLPLSRGLSIYDIEHQDGELFIAEAWEFGETPLKLPSIVLPLLRFSAFLLRLRDKTIVRSKGDR